LHIAIVLSSLRGGGAERVMLTTAIGLHQRGHQIDLVVSNLSGAYRSSVPSALELIDLKAPRVIKSTLKLSRYFRRSKPDCVISALPHINLVTIFAALISRSNTQVVLTEHNTLSQSIRNASTLKGRYLHLLMRLLYPISNRIVAVSKGVADDLSLVLRIPRNRITVIYNPVVTPKLFEQARKPLNHPWFNSSAPNIVLAAGRLTYAKNFPSLLRAFSKTKDEHDSRLVILGEGEDRAKLTELATQLGIENRLFIPGFVDNPYQYMNHSKVFVLCSRWEGLPTVLIEALACGVKVISTNCPSGPEEILENGRWGTLIPVEDDDALAKSLIDSLKSCPQDYSSAPWSRFCSSKSIDQYDKLLESLDVI